jgi:arylsulfatase A-like enzyme
LAKARNILFIMLDQLRWDYLGCAGHPHIQTPNIDALAARGVNFSRAYVQAPVCGPSRMSFYTGRYAFSHGATYNNYPLRVDEMTMGDYLRQLGLRTALVGKTHMKADFATMERLGIDPGSDIGVLVADCGFEPYERDDGLHPDPTFTGETAYQKHLEAKGYDGHNLWHEAANSAEGEGGETLSGWHMRNARKPAIVAEKDSETAWITCRAMDFITESGADPWCLHLSYIKPHWPYIAPAPYHDLYGPQHVGAPNRTAAERQAAHPVFDAFMQHPESLCFAEEECRRTVIPAYMGLIKQIDDHLGKLFAFMGEQGRLEDTTIVFTSDHGDYLGDHWLGEKELFYEEAVRVPMIIADPSSEADATRGTTRADFVEAIDLVPTFVEMMGGKVATHRVEGRSLMPLLQDGGVVEEWRDAVFSEIDYSMRHARNTVGLPPHAARAYMVRTEDWKYALFEGFCPQLFDLRGDPNELKDLGTDPDHTAIRAELHERLFEWMRGRRLRVGISDEAIAASTGAAHERGYLFGVW